MKTFRNLRIASLVQQKLAGLLIEECSFENALVTIIGVEVDGDLKEAKIKIGVMPKEKAGEAMLYLVKMRRVLQFKLGRIMNIRPMPRIRFEMAKEDNSGGLGENRTPV